MIFIGLLILIGLMIVLIFDLVSIFGCLVGLEKIVVVIIFVVLGISMLDMFVSKLVVINEKIVDSLVGNINGSNVVNVFFGLGFFWLIVFIYWEVKVSYLLLMCFILWRKKIL